MSNLSSEKEVCRHDSYLWYDEEFDAWECELCEELFKLSFMPVTKEPSEKRNICG